MVVAKMKRALLMVPVALCCAVAASLAPLPASAAACEFLSPIGGNGDGPKPWIVKKRIERTKGLLGRTNWNTDFSAAKPYGSYKLFLPLIPPTVRPSTPSRPTSNSRMAAI